jgi:hypothetical protein
MAIEMKTLKLTDKEVKKRIDQLQKYRQLEACTKGAKTILKFAKDYNLKGDFEQIRIIATVSVISTVKLLKSILNLLVKLPYT